MSSLPTKSLLENCDQDSISGSLGRSCMQLGQYERASDQIPVDNRNQGSIATALGRCWTMRGFPAKIPLPRTEFDIRPNVPAQHREVPIEFLDRISRSSFLIEFLDRISGSNLLIVLFDQCSCSFNPFLVLISSMDIDRPWLVCIYIYTHTHAHACFFLKAGA